MTRLYRMFFTVCLIATFARADAAQPPNPALVLAQRAIESQTGLYAQLLVRQLPSELDKRVPLPQAAVLLGSLVLTPLQSYGEHGSPGTIELYYDLSPPGGRLAYLGDLQHAGWLQSATSYPGTLVFCRSGAPAVLVSGAAGTAAPGDSQLRISIFRSRPGWTPCK